MLLQRINEGLPEATAARDHELPAHRNGKALTGAEHAELIRRVNEVEGWNARRLGRRSVGDASSVSTWKLPYRLAHGSVDGKRLPKAIQCILTNYRGATVAGIPDTAITDVLVRLARAAVSLGKMPHQAPATAAVYQQLGEVLKQLGRFEEVKQRA